MFQVNIFIFQSYKDLRNNVVVMSVAVGCVDVRGVAVVDVRAYPESFRSISLSSVKL